MARILWLAVPCLLLAGCSCAPGNGPSGGTSPGPTGGGPGTQAGDTLDIYEAVFRYRLEKRPADAVAYLEVAGKDAPAELLKRLRKDWPNLKPISDKPKDGGLRIYAEDIKWTRDIAAVVRAGHSFSTLSGSEGAFADHHLEREMGKWVVKRLTNETSS
jgi:hypothetical protein